MYMYLYVHTDNLSLKKFLWSCRYLIIIRYLICFAEALTDICYKYDSTTTFSSLQSEKKKKNNSGGEILRPEGFSNM